MADDYYYNILGVSKNATETQIKAAYRKKALEWHPDRNKAPEASEKFKEINQAYEVLADPKKKQMYDQFGHEAFTRQGGTRPSGGSHTYQSGPFTYTYSSSGGGNPFEGVDFGGFSDPFEIFEQFFGFQNPSRRARQRRNVYQIQISFNEAVHGATKQVKLDGQTKTIKIPAGVDDGNRIRFSDFDLVVAVSPHPQIKREGQNTYVEIPLSITQAILGDVISVPTIDEQVKVKVKPGTQPGSMLRLRGKGIPYPSSRARGDHYVVFRIHIPEKINNKQKNLLQEFEKEQFK